MFESLVRILDCFRNVIFRKYRVLQLFCLASVSILSSACFASSAVSNVGLDDIFIMRSHISNFQAMSDLQPFWTPCLQPWNFGKVRSLPNPPSRMARASFEHNMFAVCALRVILVNIFMITLKGSSLVGLVRVGPSGIALYSYFINILIQMSIVGVQEVDLPKTTISTAYTSTIFYCFLISFQQEICLPLHLRIICLKCDVRALGSAQATKWGQFGTMVKHVGFKRCLFAHMVFAMCLKTFTHIVFHIFVLSHIVCA